MKIYYLAHPVRTDEHHTEEENLDHVVRVQKILWELELRTVVPWFSYVHAFPATQDGELLEHMFNLDCEIIERLDGLILSGHRRSTGMLLEMTHALRFRKEVIDLVGLLDTEITPYLTFGLGLSHEPEKQSS